MTTYTHKRGATLSLAGTVTLPTGTWTATAKVKDRKLVAVETLTVTLTPPVAPATDHTILIVATSTQTADWPIAPLQCEVRFADSSTPAVVVPSPTFLINVVQEITNVP